MILRSRVAGCGAYLPRRVLTNAELAERVDTNDAWIAQRTGIRQRHIAGEGERTSQMAIKAAEAALAKAGLSAADIDLIVLATSTPDDTFPATATQVQAALGMTRGAAFDIQAVCSGFVFALAIADSFIRTGQARCVLVIGAETFSKLLDWDDRSTCVLFGDGAGAMILTASSGDGTSADRGVLSTHLFSDGRYRDQLYVDGGPSSTGTVGHLRMQGREVFRHAVVKMAEAIDLAIAENKLAAADIDWLVPHQANKRIIDGMAQRLGLPAEKVVVTVDRHANTSAASIPLALAEASDDGRIKPGHLVLIEAMGGGFTWGSALIRW
jgi:3-oxoacyl-[acyl-carrier-protein] synthase-3